MGTNVTLAVAAGATAAVADDALALQADSASASRYTGHNHPPSSGVLEARQRQ